ncbi:MAG: hypothetical protein H7A53_01925 [Akkermansiaceae bacterium]|nr:hypothetical protein [Akkermansiaceae bacterium]
MKSTLVITATTKRHGILRTRILALTAVFAFLNGGPTSEALPAKETSVAILADEHLRDLGDLVVSTLSARKSGIVFLERANLESLIQEGILWNDRSSGILLSAEIVVLLEQIDSEGARLNVIRAISRDGAGILWSFMSDPDEEPLAIVDRIGGELERVQNKDRPDKQNTYKTLSIGKLLLENGMETDDVQAKSIALTKHLVSLLSKTKNIKVVDRVDLPTLEFEKQLAQIDVKAFPEADYHLSGNSWTKSGGLEYRINLKRSEPRILETFEGRVESLEFGDLATAIAKQLTKSISPTVEEKTEVQNQIRSGGSIESEQFLTEARFAIRHGLFKLGKEYAMASLLLKNSDNYEQRLIHIYCKLLEKFHYVKGVGYDYNEGIFLDDRSNFMEAGAILGFAEGETYEATEIQWRTFAEVFEEMNDLAISEFGTNKNSGSISSETSTKWYRIYNLINWLRWLRDGFAWDAFQRYGEMLPQFALPHAKRLFSADRRLEELISDELTAKLFRADLIFGRLLMSPSVDGAVEYLQKAYVGEGWKREMEENPSEKGIGEYRGRWDEIFQARLWIFEYFRELASVEGRKGSAFSVVDESCLYEPFVAGFEVEAVTFESAFEAFLAGRCLLNPKIGAFESNLKTAARFGDSKSRSAALKAFRAAEFDILESGELQIYSALLMSLINFQECSDTEELEEIVDFLKWIHHYNYENLQEGGSDLTERILMVVENLNLDNEDGRFHYRDLLKSVFWDIENYNENHAEVFRVSFKEIGALYSKLGGEIDELREKNAAGLDDKLVLVLKNYFYAGRGLNDIETVYGENSTATLQFGDWKGKKTGQISIFDHRNCRFFEPIKLPDEVIKIWSESGARPSKVSSNIGEGGGALSLVNEGLRIAGPGFFSRYDLKEKRWETRFETAFEKRNGFRFLGDRLILYSDGLFRGTGIVESGIFEYLAKERQFRGFAVVGRMPPKNDLDRNQGFQVISGPVDSGRDGFLTALRRVGERSPVICSFSFDPEGYLNPEVFPSLFKSDSRSIEIALDESEEFSICVVTGGGGDAGRKEKHPLQLGVLAFNRKSGSIEYLLDSGRDWIGEPGLMAAERLPLFDSDTEVVYQFAKEFSEFEGNKVPRSFGYFDGEMFLLVVGSNTDLGNSVLYLWLDKNQGAPFRVRLDFQAFSNRKNFSVGENVEWENSAKSSLRSLRIVGGTVFLQHRFGSYYFSLESLKELVNGTDRAEE